MAYTMSSNYIQIIVIFQSVQTYTPNSKMTDCCYLALDASFPRCSPQIIPSDRHFGIRCIHLIHLRI